MIEAKAIFPPRFNPLVYREEFLKAGDATIGDFQKDTDKTESTWEHKSAYNKTIMSNSSRMRFQYWTNSEIRKYIEEGTRPHIIRARHSRTLAFKRNYKRKTRRRFVGSLPGGASGEYAFSKIVHHPGTEPMELFKKIRDNRRLAVHSRFRAAMRRANERCGHGVK